MKIYVKDNNVLQYKDKLENIDIDIEVEDIEKRHVYLGDNGVGKSFTLRMFAKAAYLYSAHGRSARHEVDKQRIMQNMIDVCVGSRYDGEASPEHYYLIQHVSSYHPESSNEGLPQTIDDDVRRVLEVGKVLQEMEIPYCLKLGLKAKEFFEKYNIIYYSNSQFPSNDTFFYERASSFRTGDVDYVFWMLFRGVFDPGKYEIHVWKNNSSPFNSRQNKEEYLDHIKRTISSDDFIEKIRYKYRHVFNYYSGELRNILLQSKLYNQIEPFFLKDEKFPVFIFQLEKMDISDYIAFLLLHEADSSFNYELHVVVNSKAVPLSKLNSGERYLLTLKCLEKVYKDPFRKTLIIVDEPENSLHLKSLHEIIRSERSNCLFWVATHSPAYAMSLLDKDPNNVVLHVMSKEDGKLKEELCNESNLPNLSLDNIAAEFFSYSPFLEKFESINSEISSDNMISIDEFYRQINELKDN